MLERVSIGNLTDNADQLLVAVIIFTQEPRIVGTTRGGDPRAVWNLTLRDSPDDTVNLTVWGASPFVFGYADVFTIGQVVEVQNPRVQTRRTEEEGNCFHPDVTSPFDLTVFESQGNSQLAFHDAPPEQLDKYRSLVAIPTKPPQSFVSLSVVHNSASSICGMQINLLVVVKSVGVAKTIETGSRQAMVRTIIVFDRSGVTHAVSMPLWNPILVDRATFWTPRETVLFIADARLEYNSFHRGIIIKLTGRSIITENPVTEEAALLREYARLTPLDAASALEEHAATIDPCTIQKVMTIGAIIAKVKGAQNALKSGKKGPQSEEYLAAKVYALITSFNIDGSSQRTLKAKCSVCQTPLTVDEVQCSSTGCANVPDRTAILTFNLRADLSDHTGTLSACRLTGNIARSVLGFTAAEFCELSEGQLSSLKWRFLLERVVARVLVVLTSMRPEEPLVSILSLQRADPADTAENMPMH